MVCGNFILPEPASYVLFYALFNLRNLLYLIFGFSKNQRKWERLSVRGKNGKEKPLLHGLLASM